MATFKGVLSFASINTLRAVAFGAVGVLAAMPARGQESPDVQAAVALVRAWVVAHRMPPNRCVLDVHRENNSYWTGALINRHLGAMFEIDTGFDGALVIPRTLLSYFVANGTITARDGQGPKRRATLADGSEVVQDTVIIRDFALPFCRAFSNVEASISDGDTPLIGQGILSLFRTTSIDHQNSLLVLDR